ncbi:YbaB/EbfC family nucleoid-associated protein [Fibrobacterota bacterium]
MNMQKMMKNVQKLQGQMNRMQSELEEKVFEAEAGGGMVNVKMNGKYDLRGIQIDPEVVDPDDVEALEDLILAAFSNVKTQIDTESQQKMGGLTQGLKIPGM